MRKRIIIFYILAALFFTSPVFASTVRLTLESFAPANFPTVSKILDVPDINDQLEISRQAALFALSPQGWNLQNMASGGLLAELSPLYYSNSLYYVRVNVPYDSTSPELIHLFGYDLTEQGEGVGGPCYTLWFHTDLWVKRLFHVLGETTNNYGTISGGMGGNVWWQTPLPNLGLFSITPVTIPIVNAGPNISITSDKQSVTTVTGTASDPNGNFLTYRWFEGSTVLQDSLPVTNGGEAPLNLANVPIFSLGSHTLDLEVSNGTITASAQMILNVGNSSPHAAPTGGGVYQINDSVLLGGQVLDFDGDPLSYEWMEGATIHAQGVISDTGGGPIYLTPVTINKLDVGLHTFTLQVSDGINQPVTANITVEIINNGAPALAPFADKTILWPPNHKMVEITIWPNASDTRGDTVNLKASVASNEPQEGFGDGKKLQDWMEPVIKDGLITLQLRAERSGKGNGRTYTVTVTVTGTDEAANSSTAAVNIVVPHNKNK